MDKDPIKDALRMMPYGIYCVTSQHGDETNAMVVTWISQVSFVPRLIAIGIQKTSFSYKLIKEGKVFAVNIFNKEDFGEIKKYTKSRTKNPDKMEDIDLLFETKTGCPILPESAAYLECRVRLIQDVGGDHDIIIGEVVAGGIKKPGEMATTLSLVDLGWSYAG